MKLVIILVVLFILVYFYRILRCALDLGTVVGYAVKIQELLKDAESTYNNHHHSYTANGDIELGENFKKIRAQLLSDYPSIIKFKSPYDMFGYQQDDREFLQNAASMYNTLLMKRNALKYDFKKTINPITALQAYFMLPSKFLRWIGFNPKDTGARLFNVFSWVFVYLANIYGSDVKALIQSIFEKLTNG